MNRADEFKSIVSDASSARKWLLIVLWMLPVAALVGAAAAAMMMWAVLP